MTKTPGVTDEEKSLINALEKIRDVIRFHGSNRLPKGASRQIDTIAQLALRPYRAAP